MGPIELVVIVSAGKTQVVDTVDALHERIVRAVTTWMKTTEEGRKAWEYASDDFNIADLVSYLDDEKLLQCLANEGVMDLRIDEPEFSTSWRSYDAILVDSGEVRQALEVDHAE